jgi:Tfp pilus assembly protein PilN
MRAVNLLPRESRSSRSVTAQNLPAVVGGGIGFVVVAALAAGYLSASSRVSAAQQSLDAAKTQLAKTPLPPPAPTHADVGAGAAAVASEAAPRLQAVSLALSQRIAWDRILREFSLVLPSDVWISSLSLSAPAAGSTTTAVPGSATGFTIQATTYSYDSVARMLSRMQLIPDLTNVTLSPANKSDRLVQFGISANVKGPAAPPAPAPAVVPPSTDSTTTTDSGSSS